MLFNVKLPVQVLHIHVMHAQIVTSGHCVDTIEDSLAACSPGESTNRDVCIRKHAMHSISDGCCHIFRVLQRGVAVQGNLHFSKIAIPRAANAHAIYIEDSRYALHLAHNLATDAGGSAV